MSDRPKWLADLEFLETECNGDIAKLEIFQRHVRSQIEDFQGDDERYNRTYNPSKYAPSVDTIYANETCLPDLKQAARDLIYYRLSYLTSPYLTMPHEPFIRIILNDFLQGKISWDRFTHDTDRHIMDIRNYDMRINGWTQRLDYTEEQFKRYQTENLDQRQTAQGRITYLLGYLPDLPALLEVELTFREYLSKPDNEFKDELNGFDFRTATIAKYRETLIKNGKQIANDMPLLGNEWHGENIQTLIHGLMNKKLPPN